MSLICALVPARALACDLALVLAVDVSGSVDPQEYRIQMDGLAAALRDNTVAAALVAQRAQVSVVQWSGATRQEISLPWRALHSHAEVMQLALDVAAAPRPWRNFSTAVGEAIQVSVDSFAAVDHCTRKVIDVSGDGISNEGPAPETTRAALRAAGITVNGLAIETDTTDLTAYFFEKVIWGEGAFVITADGFEDYPRKIRKKLQRETTKQLSLLTHEQAEYP